jgi:hypothetical protein
MLYLHTYARARTHTHTHTHNCRAPVARGVCRRHQVDRRRFFVPQLYSLLAKCLPGCVWIHAILKRDAFPGLLPHENYNQIITQKHWAGAILGDKTQNLSKVLPSSLPVSPSTLFYPHFPSGCDAPRTASIVLLKLKLKLKFEISHESSVVMSNITSFPFVVNPTLPHDSYGPQVNVTVWSLSVLAAGWLVLRIYCKFLRKRRLWWDDYVLIASLVRRNDTHPNDPGRAIS